MRDANLPDTDLEGTYLDGTDLRGANLSVANLQKTRFFRANLKNANFENAKLAGAVYYKNVDDYQKDSLTNSLEHGKPITRENEWLKEQGVENWDKAIYSDDPKPDDPKV